MKFETPATTNPIDRMAVVGQPHDRVDGPLKTTGRAPYAYEHPREVADPAYGYVLGAGIAKGRITSMDLSKAKAAPGVLAIVTAQSAGKLGKGEYNTAKLMGGPEVGPLPSGHRRGGGRELRAGPRRRRPDPRRLCPRAGPVRPGRGAEERAARRRLQQGGQLLAAGGPGRPLRAGFRRSAGEAGRDLHHPRPEPHDDGAVRLHRRLERRPAHPGGPPTR